VLAAGAVFALCAGLYRHEAQAIELRQREREAARVGMYTHYLRSELRPVTRDLRTLASGDGLTAYLDGGKESDRARAVTRAVFASRLQPSYERIRFLDENGREVFRVNRGGEIDAAAVGRDLSLQRFFREAWAVPRGAVYQSAFDLNLEGDRVARPIKPTLRFAMPVWDSAGRKRGVYVINFPGNDLLAHLQRLVPAYGHRLRVLNAGGYWIKGDTSDEEWGFVLEERGGHTLARTEPELWARIQREPAGQALRAGGLFSWQQVNPAVLEHGVIDQVVAGDKYLVIASQVSAGEWGALFAGLRNIFLVVTPVLMVLAGGGTWLLLGRRRALDALRRSEESLAITLNSIGDAVLATDTAGRITLLNPVAEELTGWKLAEARGRPVGEVFHIIHEETRAPAPIPVEAVLATGEVRGLANHTALIARNGTERAIADSAAPLRDRTGRILGVVLVFRDVTASRRAQAELDRFFTLSVDFLCISAADGYFKRVSPGVTAMLGWTVEEFLATPYLELVHPDDVAATGEEVKKQMESGSAVLNFENRYRHKDGSWRVLSWRSVPDQASGLMYATARDVTESKRIAAEMARTNVELDRSRAELRSLFESLPGLYLVLTPDFDIVTASDAYFQSTMLQREAVVGRNLFDVFPINPDDPAADGARNVRASLERVRETRQPDTMPVQKYDIRRPDGTYEERFWNPIHSPLLGPDRQLLYIIHRVEDVTDFVHAQKAGGSTVDLHSRMQKMEADIFQGTQKIQAAKEQLEVANKELESFSYSVSHDLRAPLRHIQGYVEMLTRETKDGLSEKAQRYLRTISEAGREMGTLIDDLLAFSRMGRSEMAEREVDLGALVTEVQRGLEPATRDRNIRWTIGALPVVRGDAAMLRQVLVNLLGNAVKYSRGRDPAEIEVGTAGTDEGRTVFFVRDNGAGFDMKYADKLFGVFQRLHRADEFEGTGIGLATVRRIIARHGGRTWAEGALNAGATFYFSLQPLPPPGGSTPSPS
jgi:PAS domain S-box-containing protein